MKDVLNTLLNFLMDNWEQGLLISGIAYELAARLIKTEKNRSILDFAFKIVSFLIKNRRKPSASDNVMANDNGKNLKWILIVIIIVALAYSYKAFKT